MIGILARRRAAMTVQQAAPGGVPITGLQWTVGTLVITGGGGGAARYGASTDFFNVAGTTIRYTGAESYSGYNFSVGVHEYVGSTWKQRKNVPFGEDVEISADATRLRFTFSLGSTSGLTMTQDIIDQCFAAEWV